MAVIDAHRHQPRTLDTAADQETDIMAALPARLAAKGNEIRILRKMLIGLTRRRSSSATILVISPQVTSTGDV